MDPLLSGSWALLLATLLPLLCGVSCGQDQELRETDAVCSDDSCLVAYFQRKTFLDAWRACKKRGGTLATIKHSRDAAAISSLFSAIDLPHSRSKVQVWIGLQRHPRQCSSSRLLRGFFWTTGDQDTEFTNWLEAESHGTCLVSRCVVIGYNRLDTTDNFKWLEGACSVSMDGYLCQYSYPGMCSALWEEGAGRALYSTPFNLVSSLLIHVPSGSNATVPCPNNDDQQLVMCEQKEDGSVDWSRQPPLCPSHQGWCGADNGGCEHYCRLAGGHVYCECADRYQLGEDGRSCEPSDPCKSAPCQAECLPVADSYRCTCPEGYMLAPDEESCVDVDECLQSPCEQVCINTEGSFRCDCRDGFTLDQGVVCEDEDECMNDPCDHECENTEGSYICHCPLGYFPVPEDPSRCQDIDECQYPETCQQMCVNYEGWFVCYCKEGYELGTDLYSCHRRDQDDRQTAVTPSFPWGTHQPQLDPNYNWTQHRIIQWTPEDEGPSLDWLTDPPAIQDSDVIRVTSSPLDSDPQTPEDQGEEDLDAGGAFLLEWGGRSVSEPVTTESATTESATTESATTESATTESATTELATVTESEVTPDSYDNLDEEDATTLAPLLSTTTISGGAWNWWVESTTNPQEDGHPDQPIREQDTFADPDNPEEKVQSPAGENPRLLQKEITHSQDPTVLTPLSPAQTPPSNGEGVGTLQGGGEDGGDHRGEGKDGGSRSAVDPEGEEVGQKESSLWLLVGLLVPLSIFVVVMVALGIVFCTRCSIQPRNKDASDCYHWISGAHDKQGVAPPSGEVRTLV
ncbi:CD248 molecule, endosialin a [Cheilinus undulatus]|uniref:CD248 molecule, endosialin a n=1 Tax=Cheilinus undulatus TaxID=241271 RepID=UPI001BD563DF|nr:CD248 molecule, endosialin a [Cheilinus undulatus]